MSKIIIIISCRCETFTSARILCDTSLPCSRQSFFDDIIHTSHVYRWRCVLRWALREMQSAAETQFFINFSTPNLTSDSTLSPSCVHLQYIARKSNIHNRCLWLLTASPGNAGVTRVIALFSSSRPTTNAALLYKLVWVSLNLKWVKSYAKHFSPHTDAVGIKYPAKGKMSFHSE